MIYVMSDIHGHYEKYRKMLDLIKLKTNDTLFILGDSVDRGEDGIRILCDIKERTNVVSLIGNHEWTMATLIANEVALANRIGQERVRNLFDLWFDDGGLPTYLGFMALSHVNQQDLLTYLNEMHYIVEIEVNGKKYFLSHTLPSYREDMSLLDQPAESFIHGVPDYNRRYLRNAITITGHTTTGCIDKRYIGKIWQGNGHIALDCGAAYGGPLGCLCLDTMKEYYI